MKSIALSHTSRTNMPLSRSPFLPPNPPSSSSPTYDPPFCPSNLLITSSTTFVNPSISSSAVTPAKFMLQLTYVGLFVFLARILETRVAYSMLEPLSTKGVDRVFLGLWSCNVGGSLSVMVVRIFEIYEDVEKGRVDGGSRRYRGNSHQVSHRLDFPWV